MSSCESENKLNLIKITKKCRTASLLVLLYLMMVFPRTYQTIKIPFLLVLLVSAIIVVVCEKKINIDPLIFKWYLAYLSYGLLWSFWGLINNKQFVFDFFRLNFIWVLLFLLISLTFEKLDDFNWIFLAMILASLSISIYNINYYFYSVNVPHIPFLVALDAGQRIGLHPGYVQLTAHNIGTLMFLLPFLFSLVFSKGKLLFDLNLSKLLALTFILTIFTTFLSGRRFLWFLVIFAPLVYGLIVRRSKKMKYNKRKIIKQLLVFSSLLVAAYIIIFIVLNFDFSDFIQRITFQGKESTGITYRIMKSIELLSDMNWISLLIGTGGGTATFEISFIQVFHETGIIGLSIFIGLFSWVFFQLIEIYKKDYIPQIYAVSLAVGLMCFFVSIWTNPYFGSFDFMWTLHIPIYFVNFSKLSNLNIIEHSDFASEKIFKSEITAIVVSYNGINTIKECINSALNQVDKLVIIDNASTDGSHLYFRNIVSQKISVIFNEKNEGIAKALNQGVDCATKQGAKWVLTLDQDSILEARMIDEMIEAYNKVNNVEQQLIACLAPQISYQDHKKIQKKGNGGFHQEKVVITSGNLIKIKMLQLIGGYNSELFIDSVDFDICLKLNNIGKKIVVVDNAYLFHSLGELKRIKILFFEIKIHVHSFQRKYYMSRNHIYIVRNFFKTNFLFCVKKSVFFILFLLQSAIFENHKKENIKFIFRGIKDGIIGKFGSYNIK